MSGHRCVSGLLLLRQDLGSPREKEKEENTGYFKAFRIRKTPDFQIQIRC
jgi:hypothetical protein